jgi:hypothetical protein
MQVRNVRRGLHPWQSGEVKPNVAAPSGKNEAAFRLAGQATSGGDEVFTFVSATPGAEFPQRIIYRHATEGWLYATVEGKIKGVDKQVIFPMRHVDCQTGAVVGN